MLTCRVGETPASTRYERHCAHAENGCTAHSPVLSFGFPVRAFHACFRTALRRIQAKNWGTGGRSAHSLLSQSWRFDRSSIRQPRQRSPFPCIAPSGSVLPDTLFEPPLIPWRQPRMARLIPMRMPMTAGNLRSPCRSPKNNSPPVNPTSALARRRHITIDTRASGWRNAPK